MEHKKREADFRDSFIRNEDIRGKKFSGRAHAYEITGRPKKGDFCTITYETRKTPQRGSHSDELYSLSLMKIRLEKTSEFREWFEKNISLMRCGVCSLICFSTKRQKLVEK